MADNKEEPVVDIQGALSRSEQFVESNKKSLLLILGGVVALVAIWFGYRKMIYEPDVAAAEEAVFMAEEYFAVDSLNKAINGDGTNLGFLDVLDKYGSTPTGNLCHYYLGVCYFQQGKYEEAVEELSGFDPKGVLSGSVVNSLLGDAHMELGKTEEGIDFYIKAANIDRNELTTPIALMKAGKAYEDLGKFAEAVNLYEQIKLEFPDSNEGKEIDKHLAYAKTRAGIE
ncbi:MAG: tetratricopeptide repeat protein [Bacteroidia bacterium]|nr:tetratricopeptide repeat protein [Bacteroidia bacterium]